MKRWKKRTAAQIWRVTHPRIKTIIRRRFFAPEAQPSVAPSSVGPRPEKANLADEGLIADLLRTLARKNGRRVMMVVGNKVTGDSRVIKSAETLAEAGFSVVLVGMRSQLQTLQLTNAGALPVVLIDASAIRDTKDYGAFSRGMASEICELVEHFDPTHIYSHDFWGLSFVSDCLARLNRDRLCYWTHDIHEYLPGLKGVLDDNRLKWAMALAQARLAVPDHIIVVNEKIRDLMAGHFSPHQRIDILHNTPRDGGAGPFDIRKACGLDDVTPLAVYSGRSTALRGLGLVTDALAAIPGLHVALLSDGIEAFLHDLRGKAAEIGAADRLHIFPYVPDAEIIAALSSATVGLAPFQRYGNTDLALATKLFEYIHADLPIVASDCTLMKTFIEENGIGRIFPASDAAGFVAALREVLAAAPGTFGASDDLKHRYSWATGYAPIVAHLTETAATAPPSLGVFHGPGQAAGQPGTIARALARKGQPALSVSVLQSHGFSYDRDVEFTFRNFKKDSRDLLNWAAHRFDIFHFYFRSIYHFVEDNRLKPTSLQDLLFLKAMGRKTILHFRGSEVRLHETFAKANPYAWSEAEDPLPGGDVVRREILRRSAGLADLRLVTDPELQTYVPDAEILQRAIDLEAVDAVIADVRREDGPLCVAHAPSRRGLKGTDHVIAAMEALQAEGLDIRFDLIEGLDNAAALRRLAQADVVVDQLRIGWYGVLSVEAMALGKPTLAYIRADLVERLEPDCPLVTTTIDTVKDDLRALLNDPARREALGLKGRSFVGRYHDARVVADRAMDFYEAL